MSDDNQADNDPARTLVTLEQLSQTIEVMTSVVNRLRQHLSQQLESKSESRESECAEATPEDQERPGRTESDYVQSQESFVVEISQHDPETSAKSDKTLH